MNFFMVLFFLFFVTNTTHSVEELFGAKRLSGDYHNTHYSDVQIVATGLRRFLEKLASGFYDESIFVTHASRADVVLGYLSHCKLYQGALFHQLLLFLVVSTIKILISLNLTYMFIC